MTTFEKIADCKLEELDFLDLERMKEEIEEEIKKDLTISQKCDTI